jgi:RimJ/RimL family protein N-acetyltransferase
MPAVVTMSATPSTERISTKSLHLIPQTRDETRAYIDQMPPHERAEVSLAWLAQLDGSSAIDPWIHGFVMVSRETGNVVGKCGFKGPPDADGIVEIAYGVDAGHQGKGFATEAAAALMKYAFEQGQGRIARAHTLPEANASTRVLTKCGFSRIGEVMDPDDGLVWRWERSRDAV